MITGQASNVLEKRKSRGQSFRVLFVVKIADKKALDSFLVTQNVFFASPDLLKGNRMLLQEEDNPNETRRQIYSFPIFSFETLPIHLTPHTTNPTTLFVLYSPVMLSVLYVCG